ncbi:hypothetical protein PSAB_16835 [Paenibacillus sabinae T27]|uniref:Uncharacterized protein n=1 Tax=Paenibacillus sabinae T27 TaxID=1268072 RepID=X5A383_9BACL|nr:hypothetical protein PSAB_16835 [Paenibacillus sabinae T27]
MVVHALTSAIRKRVNRASAFYLKIRSIMKFQESGSCRLSARAYFAFFYMNDLLSIFSGSIPDRRLSVLLLPFMELDEFFI